MHVKGALVYNKLLHVYNLNLELEPIRDGDKIRFLYLKRTNPLGTHVIAFNGDIPEELNIKSHIDYNQMFEKTVIEPLTSITKHINWSVRMVNTLEEDFA